MAICPFCHKRYLEPEDEQGDHPCCYCGRYWMDYIEDEEEN